jgi:hypothetical protein
MTRTADPARCSGVYDRRTHYFEKIATLVERRYNMDNVRFPAARQLAGIFAMKEGLTFITLLTILALGTVSATASQPNAKARQRLIGTWRGGLADERQPAMELVITAARISGKDLKTGESLGEGQYSVDPVKGILDAHGVANPVRGQSFLGIYSLQDDTLKWCSNNGSEKRPAKLVHNPGKGQFLLILKRQKSR